MLVIHTNYTRTATLFPYTTLFRSAPVELPRLMRKAEALAAPGRRLPETGEAIDIGLLRRDCARREILNDRVGARRAERGAGELRDAAHVAQRVAQPVGVIAPKKNGLAAREGLERDEATRHGVAGGAHAGTTPREAEGREQGR